MKQLALTAVFLISGFAQAQVTVVESRPVAPTAQTSAATQTPAASATQQTEMYFRLQALQQEVLELRGLVEEQAHELNRLKQQRHDDYMDLDRRLGAASGGGAVTRSSAVSSSPAATVEVGEADVYKAAYGQLRKRDLAGAQQGFSDYLGKYPSGEFAANSQYWLGEIYLVEGKLEQSKQWFEKVLSQFPADRKAPDAKYKLGTVYFQLNQKDKAKQLLQQVAASNAEASRLAKDFLAKNF